MLFILCAFLSALSVWIGIISEGAGPIGDDQQPGSGSSPPQPALAQPTPHPPTSSSSTQAHEQQPRQQPSQRGNVATLNDFSGGGEEPQQYFAGGGKSGMLVEGNDDEDKKGESDVAAGGGDRIQGLFEKARRAGAEYGSEEDLYQGGSDERSGTFSAFTGSARSLSGAAESKQPQQQAEEETDGSQPQEAVHNIVFYRNGFVVDDGELRSLDDPNNAEFLEALKNGRYPKELLPSNPLKHVRVNLMRKDEEYKAPEPPKYRAFQGQARTLASDAPSAASGNATGAGTQSGSATREQDSGEWHVDENQPVVKVQLRLGDGTRVIGRFNATHTVADIFRFIRTVRPDRNPQSLQLNGMPPKTLDDLSQTVKDSGAAGGVVMER